MVSVFQEIGLLSCGIIYAFFPALFIALKRGMFFSIRRDIDQKIAATIMFSSSAISFFAFIVLKKHFVVTLQMMVKALPIIPLAILFTLISMLPWYVILYLIDRHQKKRLMEDEEE